MDLNADGNIDLIGEGYAGLTYVLWGQKDGTLKKAEVLKDKSGTDIRLDVYYDFEKNDYIGTDIKGGNKGDFAKFFDWDNDGDLDLFISGTEGAILRINEGSKKEPVFGTENITVIKSHYADAFVDWDGDGLKDIIGGSKEGGVYLYKNIGGKSKPAFGEAQTLFTPEDFILDKEKGGKPKLTQVTVADYNNDGKLDLLIGNMNLTTIPGTTPTEAQIKERDEIKKRMNELGEKMTPIRAKYEKKFDKKDYKKLFAALDTNKEYKKLADEYNEMSNKFYKLRTQYESHAYVFVSLQK